MPDVIDLSTYKSDPAGVDFEDLTEEEQEAISNMAEEDPDDVGAPAVTALLLILDENGKWLASPDISIPVTRDRMPTVDDMYSAGMAVARDAQIQQTVALTMHTMNQMAMAQASQMQNAAILNKLNL